MSLKVEHYYNNSWVDISDYIVNGTSEVPYISRNRDFTPRFESWDVRIAYSLTATRSGWTNFAAKDRIRVMNDTTTLFVGYVISSPLNYSSLEFEVKVMTDIYKLHDYLIDYDTLHSVISGGSPSSTEYRPYSYYLMPTIHFTYLMKQMFSIAGLILDTSTVDNVVAFSHTWDNEQVGDPVSMDITYKDFFTGESELYCINQSIDAYHTVIDYYAYDYKKNKITFEILISALCQIFGFTIDLISTDNYQLNLITENYTIADDDNYDYKNEPIDGEEDIDTLGISIHVPLQGGESSLALSGLANNYTKRSYGEGSGLDWLDNLKIYYIKEVLAYDMSKVIPISAASCNSGKVEITTSIAHGLSAGNSCLIFGVAGMDNINAGIFGLADTKTVLGFPDVPTLLTFKFAQSVGTTYIEGGWVYKDTGTNYNNSHRIGWLYPYEITTNDILSGDEINPIKWQVLSKAADYIKEEITTEIQITKKSVIENFIDIEEQSSNIIQESY